MAKPKTTQAPENATDAIVDAIESIAQKVKDISEQVVVLADNTQKLSARLDSLETRPPETSVQESVEGEHSSSPTTPDDGILKAVNEILGDRFTYRMIPQIQGMTFRMDVIAPAEIREFEDAKSSKVLTYADGVAGIETFLRQVRDFYIGLCAKQGKPYDTYARTRA